MLSSAGKKKHDSFSYQELILDSMRKNANEIKYTINRFIHSLFHYPLISRRGKNAYNDI